MSERINLTEHSLTYPSLWQPQIPRDDLIRWLRDRLTPERPVIVVRGPDGAGKTTLLAQFAAEYPDKCFTFFAGGDPWVSSARQFLMEMCAQMHLVVGRGAAEPDDRLRDNELRDLFETYYRRLSKKARATQQHFYFVVDGLDHATRRYPEEGILDVLPTDPLSGFYLLASATADVDLGAKEDSWKITMFSSVETQAYLEDMGLEAAEIRSIHAACSGMPGYLAQIRREILSGLPVSEVLTELPSGFRSLLERQWTRDGIHEEDQMRALAVLAHSEIPLNADALATVLGSNTERLVTHLADVSLVQAERPNAPLRFVTDAHRRFVRSRLSDRRAEAEGLLISYHESDPFAESSLLQLPILYNRAGRHDALKRLVTVDYLTETLQQRQDLGLLRRNAKLATLSSYQAEDSHGLVCYSLMSAVLDRLSTGCAAESEVDALLALGSRDEALELAYRAVLPEDRLELLARVGSDLKQHELPITPDLQSELENLADAIEASHASRQRVLTIAADLFYVCPQAAVKLVERACGADSAGQVMDAMLAALSLMIGPEPDSGEMISSRIGDRTMRSFVQAYSPVVGRLTPEEVIAEADRMEDTSGQLLLLRSWCNANRETPQAIQVIDAALEVMTASADYAPSMRHLRQFAEPLRNCDPERALPALERLDLLKNTALKRPLEELARLEMLLATIEASLGLERAAERVYELYFALEEVEEWDARCSALARILAALPQILPEDDELAQEIQQTLNSEYQILLDGSAAHFAVTGGTLRALTSHDPETALRLARQLNAEARRDRAIREILRVYTQRSPGDTDLDLVDSLVDSIADQDAAEWSIVRVLERFADNDMFAEVQQSRHVMSRLSSIVDPRDRAHAYAYCAQMMASAGNSKAARHLFRKGVQAWATIDRSWEKVNIGFGLVAILAPHAPQLAREMLGLTRDEQRTTPLAEHMLAEIYIRIAELAVRAFSDVLKDADCTSFRGELIRAVDRIPSVGVRCELLANLALRHYTAGKQSEFCNIVKDSVLTDLETFQDAHSRSHCIARIAPCLFRYERALLIDELSRLSTTMRDGAAARVVRHLISSRPSDDPIDLHRLGPTTAYENGSPACDALRLIDTDWTIHTYAESLVENLVRPDTHRPGRERCDLRERQALTIATNLASLSRDKLPDLKNIQHDGYKIAVEASVARLRAASRQTWGLRARERWQEVAPSPDELAQAARGVPNIADRVLVMTWVGRSVYPSDPSLARQLLEDARSSAYAIPNLLDRASRLSGLAEAWKATDDKTSAKFFVEEAMSVLEACSWGETRDELTGQILQLAHSLDPELAATLTSAIDNPIIRQDHSRTLQALELRREPSGVGTVESSAIDMLPAIGRGAEELLTSLCSGKGLVQPERTVAEWLRAAVDAQFEDRCRVAAWSLENTLQRTKAISTSSLCDCFKGLLATLDLTWRVGEMLALVEDQQSPSQHRPTVLPEGLVLFYAGEHERALALVQEWLLEQGSSHVKIYDPFFTADDLQIVRYVVADARVDIVTSWKVQRVSPGDHHIEQVFRDSWREFSDVAPPETHVCVVGVPSTGEGPMHNRYIIGREGGLELSTSLSGLGSKDTHIRYLGAQEALTLEQEHVDPVLLGHRRTHKGERLIALTFTL